MNPTEISTAVTMMEMCFTIPTAVITESSEKTMSSSAICTITAPNAAPLPTLLRTSPSGSPSSFS